MKVLEFYYYKSNDNNSESINLLSNTVSLKALKCITDVTFEYQITNIQVHIFK